MKSPRQIWPFGCLSSARAHPAPATRVVIAWACALAIFSIIGLARAQEKTPDRNVITAEDLIRLSKEQVGDPLIIELIKAADEIPNLTAQDVIELRQAGVSANVLTAVIQRRNTTTAAKPEITGKPKRRRIRVAAILEP